MSRLWATIVCLLFISVTGQTQDVSAPAPTSPPAQASKDYSQEPFVVESYSTAARFEIDGTGDREVTARIRVQSDAGVQQLGELVFGYNSANEQMEVRYVRVRQADGTAVTAAPDAVKEMTSTVAREAPVYTDLREKHITVPSLHKGDTLEYDILTRLVTPLAPGQFWFEHHFLEGAIVLDERLDVDLPEGRVKNFDFPAESPMEVDHRGHREIHRWRHASLTRPSPDRKAKQTAQEPEQPRLIVQFTTFPSWEEVARWYAKLEQGRTEPTAEIRAKAKQLIEGRTTELEKIEALYDYVAKNIRYVSLSFGLGRYQPHFATEVLANQYGDCKDKHTLLAALLEAVGIHSDAVLIPFSHELNRSEPAPSQFDHVITAVPYKDDLIWMDSTAEVAPFRLLSAALRNKWALVVPSDGAGELVKTPADPPFLSTQQIEIEGDVSDLGKLNARMHASLRGDDEFSLRTAFRRTPQNQWNELGQTIAQAEGLRGDVTEVKPSDPADTRKPFELQLDFSQPNFLDWSSRKAKVALPIVPIGIPDAAEDATEPIRLGSPLEVRVKLKLTLPGNFTAHAPVGVAVDREYADYKSSYEFTGHVLTVERSLRFKLSELPAERASDFRAFRRAVEADESQILALENATTGAPKISSSAKADELLEAGAAALNSGNPSAAIPLFQRVIELEPKHKLAWSDLGIAQLRLGKYDEAAACFRKQIEINPYDDRAYDYLGLTYQQQQKYPDAEAAFRKQLGVNPLDPIAHAALGGLFLEQHNYAEAVPELDKATALTPDNPGLQVSLGQAYINTGKKEKALAAFEKAAELSQTPVVWNNIAYNLAEHKLDLDKALQYAESAVAATAANLRNVELSRLTLDDLNAVASIGAYWDTLGWVYFQKGDLAAADRYVRASWSLNQHGEVGDHLARIFEKRGEKKQAEHWFALAIAAPHSVPETRGRLTLLRGTNVGIDDLVNAARPELSAIRTFPAGKLLNESAHADFLILLSPGDNGARANAVQFVSGSENLRPFAERLRALDYGAMFPDASGVKLVRRGTLTCSAATGDCILVLILPEDVHTVN